MLIRYITSQDWTDIMSIQDECYHAFVPESLSVMQSKWLVSPRSCFVVELENSLVGYCLSHPWDKYNPPALEQKITQKPINPNTLYIHDMALKEETQGMGLGKALLKSCSDFAMEQSLSSISLIAVQNAAHFWKKQGFQEIQVNKDLTPYGLNSKLMGLQLNKTF